MRDQNRNQSRDRLQLTISSIKEQCFQKLYRTEEGFRRGTIFTELDKPWRVGRGDSNAR